MKPAAFAVRSLLRQPARALLGVAGIAIVGALLFDMLLLSRGLVLSFRDLLEETGYDIRLTATPALPGLGPRLPDGAGLAASLRSLPEVDRAVPIRGETVLVRDAGDAWKKTFVLATRAGARASWTIVEGTDLPESHTGPPWPVVVNRRLAEALDLRPGSELTLAGLAPGGKLAAPPAPFRVTGVAAFLFEVAGEWRLGTTHEAFAAAQLGQGPGQADFLVVASRGGAPRALEAIRRAHPDLHVFSIEEFLHRFERTDFSYFRQISFVLSTITAFFAFLLVTTLLTVSVNQRLGQVAALRAIGFSRRRVCLDLLAESALLVGAGALLALPLGGLLAWALDGILRQMPGLPARLHFFVFEPAVILLHGAVLWLAALTASLYPIYIAARLPIAATLRREVIS